MIHDKATVQEKNLHSAERMTRLDELTGIKNINAFAEFTKDINLKIKTGDEFAVLFTDSDYDQREQLLEKLRDESYENAHSRTGPTVACGMAGYNSKRDRSFVLCDKDGKPEYFGVIIVKQ